MISQKRGRDKPPTLQAGLAGDLASGPCGLHSASCSQPFKLGQANGWAFGSTLQFVFMLRRYRDLYVAL